MDLPRAESFIAARWAAQVMGPLAEYIAIPCESPAFDPGWSAAGHLDHAAEFLAAWARRALAGVPGARVEVLRLPGRTPTILVEIAGDSPDPVLVYGHFDKQPPMEGWSEGREAWKPVLEGERLYGRGGADDGYALFSAVLAILALREQNIAHPRCLVLIEGCEESGSGDLPAYIDLLASRLGEPRLIVALDAGAGDYERLWATTSVRGQVAGVLTVRVLEEGVHSGDASGVVPSSFRIATRLLARLEDPDSGEVAPEFQAPIPPARRDQAVQAAAHGDVAGAMPLAPGTQAVCADSVELLLNRSWRAQLAVTGIDGLPSVDAAPAVMQPQTALKLSLRLPPVVSPDLAASRLKQLLEADPPYGAQVSFEATMLSGGWEAPPLAEWLQSSLDAVSRTGFGAPCAFMGGGGGIPFLQMLGERFPRAQFLVTGVLGPASNAHGPNEFLHLPTARRLTAALAGVLHAAYCAQIGVDL